MGCPQQVSLGGGIFMGKNKMAARYFKVKYDFLTNEARNKCRPNTSFSYDFDWVIYFLFYFHDSMYSSRLTSQFQGQVSKNNKQTPTNTAMNMCNTSFS